MSLIWNWILPLSGKSELLLVNFFRSLVFSSSFPILDSYPFGHLEHSSLSVAENLTPSATRTFDPGARTARCHDGSSLPTYQPSVGDAHRRVVLGRMPGPVSFATRSVARITRSGD